MTISAKSACKTLLDSLFVVTLLIVLVPLLRTLSPIITFNGIPFYIAYLPVSLFIAVVCVYGFRIFPALLLGVLIAFRNELNTHDVQTVWLAVSVTASLLISQWALKRRLGQRCRADMSNREGMLYRLFCLGLLYPLLMQIAFYLVGYFMPIEDYFQYYFSMREVTLLFLNMQSLALPAVVFTFLFYHSLRAITSRNYARKFWQRHLRDFFRPERRRQAVAWLACVLVLTLSCIGQTTLLSGYAIPIILLFFAWGFIKLNHTVVACLWSVVVYLLIQCDTGFIKQLEKDRMLICFSALFIVFTITNIWLAVMKAQLNHVINKLSAASRRDPLNHLPNLQALAYDMKAEPSLRCLCYIKLFAIDTFEKHLGLTFKSNIKIALYSQLKRLLGEEARIYATPDSDILLLLPERQIRPCLQRLLTDLSLTELSEEADVCYGISWQKLRAGDDLYQTICGLEYLATVKGEGKVSALHENDELVEKYTTLDIHNLNIVRQAIQQQGIRIYTQKIASADGGEDYYEVLCRLAVQDRVLLPHEFLPLVSEFGLCATLDFRIIDCFLQQYCAQGGPRRRARYAINIMPETLGDEQTGDKILAIFRKYQLSARAFVFEVTEEQLFFKQHVALKNIEKLRRAGFSIAIDDFGKGYANYERLKMLNADIIKIDGMFVKGMIHNKLDAVIVKSIIDIAKAKNMKVVAEFVETASHVQLLRRLGVDYLQGYYIGKPEPLRFAPLSLH